MTKYLYENIFEKAEKVRSEYCVDTYPVSFEKFEEIFEDLNYKLKFFDNCDKSCVIGNMLIVGNTAMDENEFYQKNSTLSDEVKKKREALAHEAGHMFCHSINQLESEDISLSKEESQADAFSLYFLVPDDLFKEFYNNSFSMYGGFNAYEASDMFGVTVDFIMKRKKYYEKSIRHEGEKQKKMGYV